VQKRDAKIRFRRRNGRPVRSHATTCNGGHVDRHRPINKAAYLLQDKSPGNDLSRERARARGEAARYACENLPHDFSNRRRAYISISVRDIGAAVKSFRHTC